VKIFNRENNLKHNLLAAIALSLIVISSANAETKTAVGTPLAFTVENPKIGATNSITKNIDPATGAITTMMTTTAFAPIQSSGMAQLAASQIGTIPNIMAGAEQGMMSIAPATIASINIPVSTYAPEPSISQLSALATPAPSATPPCAGHHMVETGDRKNLSIDMPAELKILSKPANENAITRMSNHKTSSLKDNKTENRAPAAKLLISQKNRASFFTLQKAASVIDSFAAAKRTLTTVKQMTTGNIKILRNIRGKTNELANGIAKGLIPVFKMAITSDQEPVLTALHMFDNALPDATSNNHKDPAIPPVCKIGSGNSIATVTPFSDTVSRYIPDQTKPLNSVHSFIINDSSVNYSKTGLSPPAAAIHIFPSSFLSKGNTSSISIPLPLNRIIGLYCKGFSIYTNLFNREEQL